MADTARTITDLINNLFQDGQPAGSITPQDMRDLIRSFVPSFGGYFMVNNATATAIAVAGTWYKIAGITTAYPDLVDFTMPADNKITYSDTIIRHMHINVAFGITSAANNQSGALAAFKNGVKIDASEMGFKTAASGDPRSVSLITQVDMIPTDYIEVYVKNDTGANNITVSHMNLGIDGHVHDV